MLPKGAKTSEPEDEQEKCRLYAKKKLSAYNPRHIGKWIKYCNSLTQQNTFENLLACADCQNNWTVVIV